MAAKEVLTGIQIHRNGRYPYDYEQVFGSYSDVLENIESDGNQGTKKGTFYAGLYTAVVDDENSSYNGPYYISYQKTGSPGNIKITYQANRIPLANEITEIEKDWQASYDNIRSYITNNYASHKQLKSTGECVDAAYVTNLGKEANLNVILSSLLNAAIYTKPTYTFNIKNGENGKQYENGSKVEVGTNISLCANFDLNNYNSDPNNKDAKSYGLDYCTFTYGGNYYEYDSAGNYNYGYYTFNTEGTHVVAKNIRLGYLESSYTYYPQLSSKNVYVLSKENWFSNGEFALGNYSINAQYKYYYGWDADTFDENVIKRANFGWLPIGTAEIKSPNIAFDKAHTSFWFAIPSDVAEHVKTGNFEVLYHTSIGDADLKSTSAVKEEVTKTITVGNTTHSYKVIKIDFKKEISGASGNYVKFTIKKK